MDVDGTERRYRVHLSSQYDPGTAIPLVISFHGWRGTGVQQSVTDKLYTLADEDNFMVVWPLGVSDHASSEDADSSWSSWNAGGSSGSPGPQGETCTVELDYCYTSCQNRAEGCGACDWTTCIDDVAFTDALLDTLEESFCLDRCASLPPRHRQ